MILGSIFFGAFAMISYGLGNVFAAPLAKRFGAVRVLWLRGLVMCVLLGVVSIPVFLSRSIDWQAALAAFGIGVLGYLPPLAFVHGIKISRVGIVSAIAGTAPFITILLSVIWLGTHLQSIQWWGAVLIIAANVAMSVNFRSLRNSNILKLASGVPYGLIAAILWGLVFFLIIYPARALGPLLATFLLELGVVVAAGVHLLIRKESLRVRHAATWPIVSNGLLILGGTLAYNIGVTAFNIGIVAALSNSTAVVSIIVANMLHHEHLLRREKILAALMVLGVILISIIQ